MDVSDGCPSDKRRNPVAQRDAVERVGVEVRLVKHRVRTARRDVTQQHDAASLDLRFVEVDQRHKFIGIEAGKTVVEDLYRVECVVVPSKSDSRCVSTSANEQTGQDRVAIQVVYYAV